HLRANETLADCVEKLRPRLRGRLSLERRSLQGPQRSIYEAGSQKSGTMSRELALCGPASEFFNSIGHKPIFQTTPTRGESRHCTFDPLSSISPMQTDWLCRANADGDSFRETSLVAGLN
ncbi:hypothetical protein, partial [Rhodovulum sulfidophilum]|uniref:hypothetical protein n=1 Tax=Rhodovulum sulfidophilum TaxID=35806 RepID=UPI001EE4C470